MTDETDRTETSRSDRKRADDGVRSVDGGTRTTEETVGGADGGALNAECGLRGSADPSPGEGLEVLQIASSQMEFYRDQVRVLEELGVRCESLSYPPNPDSPAEADRRTRRIHEGLLRRIYGHNGLYYAYRAADYYPWILRTAAGGDHDLVHVNSGMVAPLALLQPERPLVLTLWGDDLLGDRLGGYQSAITEFCAKRCDRVIVRSEEMREALPCDAEVIPSGVDMEKFKPVDRGEAQAAVGWDTDARHVLFPYPTNQTKKRYPVARRLVERADEQLDDPVRLQVVDDVPHERMYLYYNAADVLLLPSLREGSPNTVKEAMACNVPVVSTDVGDVATRLGPVKNARVCESDDAMEEALLRTLEAGGRSDGREHVEELSLERMGRRLIEIYESVLEERDA